MRVGMSTFGCDGGRSGIGQYTLNLLREFRNAGWAHDLDVLHYRGERGVFASDTPGEVSLSFSDRLHNTWLGLTWYQVALPRICRRRGHRVFFFPEANRRLPYSLPCPSVGTVHDFSSLHMAGKYDPVREIYIKRALPMLIRRLTRIITVSQCTKDDVVRFAGVPEERVSVVHHGVDLTSFRPGSKERAIQRVQARYNVQPPFILYIARVEHPGKNHVRLIQAFARLKSRQRFPHSLVLAGSDWTRAADVHRAAKDSEVAGSIVFTGFVPSENLVDLYTAADMFVFPSLFEGFGMPILEAMACGTPIACSNCSSLPEVGGSAAEYFDPTDDEAMASAMARLLTDSGLRQNRIDDGLKRARQFSWEAAARRTHEIIEATATHS